MNEFTCICMCVFALKLVFKGNKLSDVGVISRLITPCHVILRISVV